MLPVGIVLVDAEAHILHCNEAATAMLHAGDPIISLGGQIRATTKSSIQVLSAAIRRAASGDAALRPQDENVPLPYRDGRAAVAHLRRREFSQPAPGRETVAIFITDALARAMAVPPDALTALFRLTRSEARVLVHIVSGKNRGQTAVILGVAETTVKTHLEGIYSKTGTSDRLGLCRLVASLSWTTLVPTAPPRPKHASCSVAAAP